MTMAMINMAMIVMVILSVLLPIGSDPWEVIPTKLSPTSARVNQS